MLLNRWHVSPVGDKVRCRGYDRSTAQRRRRRSIESARLESHVFVLKIVFIGLGVLSMVISIVISEKKPQIDRLILMLFEVLPEL